MTDENNVAWLKKQQLDLLRTMIHGYGFITLSAVERMMNVSAPTARKLISELEEIHPGLQHHNVHNLYFYPADATEVNPFGVEVAGGSAAGPETLEGRQAAAVNQVIQDTEQVSAQPVTPQPQPVAPTQNTQPAVTQESQPTQDQNQMLPATPSAAATAHKQLEPQAPQAPQAPTQHTPAPVTAAAPTSTRIVEGYVPDAHEVAAAESIAPPKTSSRIDGGNLPAVNPAEMTVVGETND